MSEKDLEDFDFDKLNDETVSANNKSSNEPRVIETLAFNEPKRKQSGIMKSMSIGFESHLNGNGQHKHRFKPKKRGTKEDRSL